MLFKMTLHSLLLIGIRTQRLHIVASEKNNNKTTKVIFELRLSE